jgi:hypothetical protein
MSIFFFFLTFLQSKKEPKRKEVKKKRNQKQSRLPLSGLEPEWTLCPQTPQACASTNFTITVITNLLYHCLAFFTTCSFCLFFSLVSVFFYFVKKD